ncbi:MAG: anti-sigma factor domain-containing protein [Lachnospiraceae bacterium]|nr:anti-sigma factor domain-containing protein [Lachnospiraceae bacterium]
MKAVIVDLNGNDAVALRDDGRFEKIKNKNYSIGQEITLQAQTIRFPKQAAIAASVAIVIAACGGMGTYTWSNPISYVSLDINPSIAYSLNEFNRVITVSGMNEEGSAVVDAIGDSLKNTDITTALSITVEQLSTDAYLDSENTNYMIIGVYSDKDSKADALMSTVDEFTANSAETCSITTVNVSKETKETADSYGITGGKMELINEIANVAADPEEVDPAALADLTVAELEQTKTVAASGTSVTEAVAAVIPTEKAAETSEETPAASNETTSDSKPSNDIADESSEKKEDSSAEKPVDTSSPVAASAEPSAPAGDSSSTSSKSNTTTAVTGSNTTSTGTASTDKKGDGSSDKKEEVSTSPTKPESTSPAKKDDSDSSDKKDNASSDKKGSAASDKNGSSSDKQDSSSSGKHEDVTEDSSQQTNSNLDPVIPDESEAESGTEPDVEIPVSGDNIIACSITV